MLGLLVGLVGGTIAGMYLERRRGIEEQRRFEYALQVHRRWLETEVQRRNRLEVELAELRRTIADASAQGRRGE